MGTKVQILAADPSKPSMVITTVAAASFTIADTDLALWIGASFAGNKLEEINCLKACIADIRANGNNTPTGANESYAEALQGETVNSAFDSAAVIPEEIKVGIWYGPLFQQNEGSSIEPFAIKGIEAYLEQVQKAA